MMKNDSRILQLINKIDAGKISPEDVSKFVDLIEKKDGPLDILYDVENRNDEEYYEELVTNARLGVYNRDSLIRMAEIKYSMRKDLDNRKKIAMCVGAGFVIVLVTVLIISIINGRS